VRAGHRLGRLAPAAALGFAVLAAVVGLGVGTSGFGFGDLASSDLAREIVWSYRLPRVVLGLLVGGALALSGLILQALLRNDLAEPYLVGVGPGAFLGVTVAGLLGAGAGLLSRGAWAFLGASGVALLVFAGVRRSRRLSGPALLLAGVAIGAFVSAVSTAALYVRVPDWEQVVFWLLGHLHVATGAELALLAAVLLLGVGVALWRARDLDAVALGEEGAWLVGVDVRRLLLGLGLLACLLAAAAVALSGLIGFVGLLVPHLARRLGGPRHRVAVPTALGLGAGLLVLADALARTVHPPLVLPVGVVTAGLGAPALAFLLLRAR
jgi:iron complex transport system permease protein